MPNDMDATVAFVMTEEQTDIFRKDYEFRLEINAEREDKFPIFAENIKIFQKEKMSLWSRRKIIMETKWIVSNKLGTLMSYQIMGLTIKV